MESLALTFTSGCACGVNSYLVVLVLGVADRVGHVSAVPDVLATGPVLAIAAAMYAVEFVADKVPWVDSTWDAVSTVIRPVVGGVLGVLIAGEADSLNSAAAASVGGGSALAAHSVKAGGRLAINTLPEPFTNVAASLTEDVVVLAVVWFAVEHPVAAASIAAVLLVFGLIALWFALRLVRRGWQRWKAWRSHRGAAAPSALP